MTSRRRQPWGVDQAEPVHATTLLRVNIFIYTEFSLLLDNGMGCIQAAKTGQGTRKTEHAQRSRYIQTRANARRAENI